MRLDINKDTQARCNLFDVFFNGVKQTLCTVADEEKGYIERYKFGMGRRPIKNRFGKIETVRLSGKVEIKRKQREGNKDRPQQTNHSADGSAVQGIEGSDTGTPERAPCTEAVDPGAPTE